MAIDADLSKDHKRKSSTEVMDELEEQIERDTLWVGESAFDLTVRGIATTMPGLKRSEEHRLFGVRG